MDNSADDRFRAAAIAYVQDLESRNGGLVDHLDLKAFEFEGQPVSLMGQRGIRKVAGLDAAISITTTYVSDPTKRPYEDDPGPDGYPRYKWQGSDPDAYDNTALRTAMELGKPLIYFQGVAPGTYEVACPVWLAGEEPDQQQFVMAVSEDVLRQWVDAPFHPVDLVARRQYVERLTKERLHQPRFRARVLLAYNRQCALCRLRHPELLEAAHIREDKAGGEPIVPNGIAMCAIHHLAFDKLVIGIRPDYTVEVQSNVLREKDGPTLQHALQGVHHTMLTVPRQHRARPDPSLLEERYERFRQAG